MTDDERAEQDPGECSCGATENELSCEGIVV